MAVSRANAGRTRQSQVPVLWRRVFCGFDVAEQLLSLQILADRTSVRI